MNFVEYVIMSINQREKQISNLNKKKLVSPN